MHVNIWTALIVASLAGSIMLVVNKGERLFPLVALVASALEALIAFHVIQLSVARFRIDIILPALLVLAGAICWSRSESKSSVTSATVVTLVGAIQLLVAVRVFT